MYSLSGCVPTLWRMAGQLLCILEVSSRQNLYFDPWNENIWSLKWKHFILEMKIFDRWSENILSLKWKYLILELKMFHPHHPVQARKPCDVSSKVFGRNWWTLRRSWINQLHWIVPTCLNIVVDMYKCKFEYTTYSAAEIFKMFTRINVAGRD